MGFNIQVLADAHATDLQAAVQLWVREVTRKTNLEPVTRLYDDVESMLRAFQRKDIDLANGTALDYLRISREVDVEVAFGGSVGGRATRKYLVLVRADSPYADIKDLAGKRLAVRMRDDVGRLFLDTLLLRSVGREAPEFFLPISEKKKFSQVVLAVFFGQADVCVTTDTVFRTMTELNPQVGRRLRPIAVSPELLDRVSFFRKGYSPRAKQLLTHEASMLAGNEHGKQFLTLFKIDGVALLQDSDLDSVRVLLKEYEQRKADRQRRSMATGD